MERTVRLRKTPAHSFPADETADQSLRQSQPGSLPRALRATHRALEYRLDDFRAQQAELADDSIGESTNAPTPADLATTASQLETVIANGEPEQAKALLRTLIAELRVNGRHDIQPTYRVITPNHPATTGVCATSGKVGRAGIEPATLGLRGPCSAS